MTKRAIGKGTVVVDGETYDTETFDLRGTLYTIRELSADEGDDIADAATDNKDKFNSRLNSRMLLAKAIVEPETSVEALGKLPGPKYLAILQAFNRLNSLPVANPTLPAGSAEQTSPDSGEPTPQP